MQYHVVLTERCNLCCGYCGGTRHVEGIPLEVAYDVEILVNFIRHDHEAVIGFYGGEPLLALGKMYEIMDRVPAEAFTLQTNATHLDDVDPAYLKRLDAILVSVDGGREVTDANRHEGVYDTVMRNCGSIRRKGYVNDLVARMAFSRKGDIYRDVTHLLNLKDPAFNHVHWQLDVFWSEIRDEHEVEKWLGRYDEGITRLVRDFGDSLEKGVVPGIVPFIPVLRTLLTGEPVPHIWCGSGRDSFAVMTSGRIDVCPIAPELPYSSVGDIRNSTPESLRDILPVGEPCSLCPDKWVCGGRCLFANKTTFWGEEWFKRVCASTHHMIHELGALVEPTRELMRDGTLKPDALDYPRINNGCEIIP
ncbi:MAG: TIGR04084 family radical SAM/SPASM domain-containing protein [Candidatus Bathyarchaeota archaeon]|nr:TIGR04084 family radical SAM/SPASM domain-containing protein [Candidatus Bathyarchaeota archaeon]